MNSAYDITTLSSRMRIKKIFHSPFFDLSTNSSTGAIMTQSFTFKKKPYLHSSDVFFSFKKTFVVVLVLTLWRDH